MNRFVYSQEDTLGYSIQLEIVKKTDTKVKTLEDLVYFDELLKNNLITITKIKAMVYVAKAEKHWALLYSDVFMAQEEPIEDYESILTKLKPELSEILNDYSTAIQMCIDCAVEYQYLRFTYLNELKNLAESVELNDIEFSSVYTSDYAMMKSLGYRDDRIGFGIGSSAIHGNDNWMGIEFSFVSAHEPMNRLKYRSAIDSSVQRYWINIYPVNGSWLTLGYNYGLASGSHDFNFDLMSITSPFHLNLFKFGALKTSYSDKLLAYYRPEIGLGFGCFSLFYAYNTVFKKSMRDLSEKHLIGIKIKLIPFRNNSLFD